MVNAVGLVVFMLIVNRLAGLKDWALPGKPLIYITPMVGFATYVYSYQHWLALYVMACFVLWRSPSWGYLTTLGNYTPERPQTVLEEELLELANGSYTFALFLRMLFVVPMGFVELPAGIAVASFAALFFTMAFWLAWIVAPKNPIHIADYVCGAVWGLLIIWASYAR